MKEKTIEWLGIVGFCWAGVNLIYCILQLGIIRFTPVITILSVVGVIGFTIYYSIQDAKINKIDSERANKGLKELEKLQMEDKEAGRFLGLATVIDERALCKYITKAIADRRILVDDRVIIGRDIKMEDKK